MRVQDFGFLVFGVSGLQVPQGSLVCELVADRVKYLRALGADGPSLQITGALGGCSGLGFRASLGFRGLS